MIRRTGVIAGAVTFAALLCSATAMAATKVVYAGAPPQTKALAAKLLGKRGVIALGRSARRSMRSPTNA
jgi:hypothetical protein